MTNHIEDAINEVAKIPPISRYFSDKEDFMPKCTHGVPLDSECKECSDDFINEALKVECCPHGVPFEGPIGCEKCYKEALNKTFKPYTLEFEAHNNGGKTDYYDLPKDAKCCQDIIEWREMNFQQGNIFKVAFTFNCGRHNGTDYRRDLNKIIYFAQRELERLTNENPRT